LLVHDYLTRKILKFGGTVLEEDIFVTFL